jgi:hypothetical protein
MEAAPAPTGVGPAKLPAICGGTVRSGSISGTARNPNGGGATNECGGLRRGKDARRVKSQNLGTERLLRAVPCPLLPPPQGRPQADAQATTT